MMQRPDLVGQLFGRYQLLRLLGAGGFAEVYLGEHLDLGRQAAIKVLRAQLAPTDIDAFRAEARIIANLNHPHIIPILDFNVQGSIPFLVMGYAAGGTTRQYCPKGTIIPLPTIVFSIQQVADALQYAHDNKIIHRDIKPENILLDERGNVLLSDFGIALLTQSSRYQSTQEVIGTAAYMSPEQIQGKPRAASDQYSLGIVVYEWLSGTRPFEGSFAELCAQHMFAPPPSLREKIPTISPQVEQVVMTALTKDPQQRFGDIRTFANALRQASEAGQAPTMIAVRPQIEKTIPANPVSQPGQPHPALQASTSMPQTPPVASVGGQQTNALPTFPSLQLITKPEAITILRTFTGHTQEILSVALSADGRTLVSRSLDRTVKVWNVQTGQVFYTPSLGSSDAPTSAALSADGRMLAIGFSSGSIQLWNAQTGHDLRNSFGYSNPYSGNDGHEEAVTSVVLNADGRVLVSSDTSGKIYAWNIQGERTSKNSDSYSFNRSRRLGAVGNLALSADGLTLVRGSSKTHSSGTYPVMVYRKTQTYWQHSWLEVHKGAITSVALSADGHLAASGSFDGTIRLWDTGKEKLVRTLKDMAKGVALNADGRLLATASSGDGTIKLWNTQNGKLFRTLTLQVGSVSSVALSTDGRILASGSSDGTVNVWGIKG